MVSYWDIVVGWMFFEIGMVRKNRFRRVSARWDEPKRWFFTKRTRELEGSTLCNMRGPRELQKLAVGILYTCRWKTNPNRSQIGPKNRGPSRGSGLKRLAGRLRRQQRFGAFRRTQLHPPKSILFGGL